MSFSNPRSAFQPWPTTGKRHTASGAAIWPLAPLEPFSASACAGGIGATFASLAADYAPSSIIPPQPVREFRGGLGGYGREH